MNSTRTSKLTDDLDGSYDGREIQNRYSRVWIIIINHNIRFYIDMVRNQEVTPAFP